MFSIVFCMCMLTNAMWKSWNLTEGHFSICYQCLCLWIHYISAKLPRVLNFKSIFITIQNFRAGWDLRGTSSRVIFWSGNGCLNSDCHEGGGRESLFWCFLLMILWPTYHSQAHNHPGLSLLLILTCYSF